MKDPEGYRISPLKSPLTWLILLWTSICMASLYSDCTVHLIVFKCTSHHKSVYPFVSTSELKQWQGIECIFFISILAFIVDAWTTSTTVCWFKWNRTETNLFQLSRQSNFRLWKGKEYFADVASQASKAFEDNCRSRYIYLLRYIIYKIKKGNLVMASER